MAGTDSNLEDLCDDLKSVYTTANLNDIDALVSYIEESRENIKELYSITDKKKYVVNQMLISSGRGLTSCFPKPQSGIGFVYGTDWHKQLYQNGKFPDGVNASVSGSPIGGWSNIPPVLMFTDRNTGINDGDYAHLSHIHIQVN